MGYYQLPENLSQLPDHQSSGTHMMCWQMKTSKYSSNRLCYLPKRRNTRKKRMKCFCHAKEEVSRKFPSNAFKRAVRSMLVNSWQGETLFSRFAVFQCVVYSAMIQVTSFLSNRLSKDVLKFVPSIITVQMYCKFCVNQCQLNHWGHIWNFEKNFSRTA